MKPQFDAREAESRIYRGWEDSGAFRAGANARPGAPSFCIVIPPPNVTGALHMGHAFNNTLQDILVRWHRMRGDDVLWQPGQDHAGIATQMVVERQLEEQGEPGRRELGRVEFLRRIWDWKDKSGDEIINQLRRLGASCDWSRNRFTMDEGFHDAVLRVFVELYRQGHIYRGKRLVNWDPHFETAISDLEVEQVEMDGKMWHFRYHLEDGTTYNHPIEHDDEGNPVKFQSRDYLVVATTRPETMLGDTGVAVHPDDPRYAHLVGKRVILPLARRAIPIVADRYADPEKGTGAVKITPAHDFNDWDVGQRTGLPAVNVMTEKAAMYLANNKDFLADSDPLTEVFDLDGMDRYDARKRIVELATSQGWLDGIEEDRHTVPHGDRSKVAVEPFLTDQWFVDAAKIVTPAIEAVRSGRTRIYPEQYEKTYYNWLENIEPWCISRQLWWGHQVPVWYDEDGGQYCATSEAEAQEMAGDRCIRRDEDVLDTWFSSGLWPIGTLGWPQHTPELKRYFPTDVLVTGFDIIFFWVARMMMMQLALVGDIPFHTIYVHALVRDEKGKKMSKSIGNVIDPLELTEKYGADALRFTLASMAVMGRDLKLSTGRVAGYRNFVTKIWNAARFVHMNGCTPENDFDPASVTHPVNRWIVNQTATAAENTDNSLESFRFNDAANGLYDFFWSKYCDWYLELSKPLLAADDPELVTETKATLGWVLKQSMLLLHPVIPFVTEEIWHSAGLGKSDLIVANWPQLDSERLRDREADREINWMIELVTRVRSVRSTLRVPAGSRISLVGLEPGENARRMIERHFGLISRLARLDEYRVAGTRPEDSASLVVDGGEFCLPLAGVIDLETERLRLENDLANLETEQCKLLARLGNANFLAKAPPDVIEKDRDRLAGIEVERKARLEALSQV